MTSLRVTCTKKVRIFLGQIMKLQ